MKRQDKLVYLAGPYSHRLNRIRHRRYNQLTEVSARLLQNGILNFSPITHSHNQHEYLDGFATTFEDWRRNDLAYVSRCEEIWVLMIPGWDKSYGVDEELKYARKHGVGIKYIHVEKEDLVITDSATGGNTVMTISGERSTL